MALGEIDAPFFGVPRKEKREKRRKSTPFFAVGGLASGLSAGWVCPVDHLRLLYVLDKSSLAEGLYCLSDGGYGSPPGVGARSLSQPPLRLSRRRGRTYAVLGRGWGGKAQRFCAGWGIQRLPLLTCPWRGGVWVGWKRLRVSGLRGPWGCLCGFISLTSKMAAPNLETQP